MPGKLEWWDYVQRSSEPHATYNVSISFVSGEERHPAGGDLAHVGIESCCTVQ